MTEGRSPDGGYAKDPAALPFLLLFLAVAAAVFAYLPSLHGPFFLDDVHNIVENPSIRMTGFSAPALLQAMDAPPNVPQRRPLPFATFALNYALGRYDPFGYRLFNLAVLLLSIPSAFLCGLLLCRRWHDRATALRLALGTVFVWSLHPLLTNGVTYIVQRMTSLCTLFCLLALAFFLAGFAQRSPRWHAAALILWLAALASKEIAVLLPFPAALFLWFSLPQGTRGRRVAALGLGAAVVASQAALLFVGSRSPAWEIRPFSMFERALTEGRVVLRYLSLFAAPLPSRMNLDYDFTVSTSLFSPPATALALFLHAALVVSAFMLRNRRPLLAFGVLSFYLLQLLEGTFLPLEIIFEHRAYLPSFFLALAAVDGIHWGLQRVIPRQAGQAVLALAVLLGLAGGMLTRERNRVWAGALSLAEDIVAKSPGKSRAHHNLAVILMGEGHLAGALRHLDEAIRLMPNNAEYYNTAGNAMASAGRDAEAAEYFSRALRMVPSYAEAANNLGNIYFRQGRFEDARESFERALELKPFYPEANYNLAALLSAQGDLTEAAVFYRRAIDQQPEYAAAHYNLGTTLGRLGDLEGAERHLLAAVRLDPGRVDVHYNLGVIYAQRGEAAKAAASFSEALRLNADYVPARRGLEEVMARSRP